MILVKADYGRVPYVTLLHTVFAHIIKATDPEALAGIGSVAE